MGSWNFGKAHDELFAALPALLITDTHPDRLTENSLRLIVALRQAEERFGTSTLFLTP